MVDRTETVVVVFREEGLDELIAKMKQAKADRDALLGSGGSATPATTPATTGLGGFQSAQVGGFAATGAGTGTNATNDVELAARAAAATSINKFESAMADEARRAAGGQRVGVQTPPLSVVNAVATGSSAFSMATAALQGVTTADVRAVGGSLTVASAIADVLGLGGSSVLDAAGTQRLMAAAESVTASWMGAGGRRAAQATLAGLLGPGMAGMTPGEEVMQSMSRRAAMAGAALPVNIGGQRAGTIADALAYDSRFRTIGAGREGRPSVDDPYSRPAFSEAPMLGPAIPGAPPEIIGGTRNWPRVRGDYAQPYAAMGRINEAGAPTSAEIPYTWETGLVPAGPRTGADRWGWRAQSTALVGAEGGAVPLTDRFRAPSSANRPYADAAGGGFGGGGGGGGGRRYASAEGRESSGGARRPENINMDEIERAAEAAARAGRTGGDAANQVDTDTLDEFIRADRRARGVDPEIGVGPGVNMGGGGGGGRGGGAGGAAAGASTGPSRPGRSYFMGGFGQRVSDASMAAFPFAMAGMTLRFGGMPLIAANQQFAAADQMFTNDPSSVAAGERLLAAQAQAGRRQAGVRNFMTNAQAGGIEMINQIPFGPEAMAVGGSAMETGANVMDMVSNAALFSVLAFGNRLPAGGLIGAAGRGLGAVGSAIGGAFQGMFSGAGSAASSTFRMSGVGANGVINMTQGAGGLARFLPGIGAILGGVELAASNFAQTGSVQDPGQRQLMSEVQAATAPLMQARGPGLPMMPGAAPSSGAAPVATAAPAGPIEQIMARQMAEARRMLPVAQGGDPQRVAAEQEMFQRANISFGIAQQRMSIGLQEQGIEISRSQMLRGQAFERDQQVIAERYANDDVSTGVRRARRDLGTQTERASRDLTTRINRSMREINTNESDAIADVGINLADTEEDIRTNAGRTRRDILLAPALTGQAGALIRAGMAERDALADARRGAGRARGAIGRQATRARGAVTRQGVDASEDIQTGAGDAFDDIQTGAGDAREDIKEAGRRQREAMEAAQGLQRQQFEEQAQQAQRIIALQKTQIDAMDEFNRQYGAKTVEQTKHIENLTKAYSDALAEMEKFPERMRSLATGMLTGATT